ncbi:MAG TPA: glycosyltransferase [Bryobacteraceae bacterium]|nr:glycosyltransferase [Bryobacteraceae bacterium]
MKILITNLTLAGRTGTEMVTRDLALALAAQGHQPVVFSPNLGPVADEMREGGVAVVTRLEDVAVVPDVIHGHHHVQTTLAMLHFTRVPAIFVCHDRFSWYDSAPQSPQIRRYVAVDRNCAERLAQECAIPAEQIRLIHNAVDTRRFRRRDPLPAQVKRALIFSNYAAAGTHLEPVRQACSLLDIPVDVLGEGVQASSHRPEEVLPRYDLVFAKARCALEAMAAGCAVILCDTRGLGPLVRLSDVADLRDWNFGMRCLQQRPLPGAIAREMLSYNAEEAGVVSSWIRENAHLDGAVAAYLQLYEEVVDEAVKTPVQVNLGEVLTQLATQSGTLEARVRSSGMFVMPPLPAAAVRQIVLRPVERMRSMPAGSGLQVMIEVQNDSQETIASLAPHPVNLAYHWLDPISGDTILFEGHRTALSANIRAGSIHRQLQLIHAPASAGRFLLRLLLVQESVCWFDDLNSGASENLVVDITPPDDAGGAVPGPKAFDLEQAIRWTFGLTVSRNASFSNLGFLSNPKPGMLTFVESPGFAEQVGRMPEVTCVITTRELASRLPATVGLALCEAPRTRFVDIHNHLAATTTFYWDDFPTSIHPTARVHPGTRVPEFNVVIGRDAVVEQNVTILEHTILGDRSVVQSGAVLGAEGLQSDRSSATMRDMAHAGGLRIEADAKIFANAVLARGVFREFTRIGPQSRIGNGSFISHNVTVGCRAIIGHGAVVNGNCEIADNAWIGPNVTIANGVSIGRNAHVSLGATVLRDVKSDTRVMGAFATESRKMIRLITQIENFGKKK